MKGVIAFDMDGVLANFIRGFTRLGHRMYGTAVGDTPSQEHWMFEEVPSLGLTKEQVGHPIRGGGVWGEVIKSPHFWINLDPYNVSIMHTIDRIKNKVFITNRLGVLPLEQTVGFLERWGVIDPLVIIASNKGPVAKEMNVIAAIDDYLPNCQEIKSHCPDAFTAMLAVPYNTVHRQHTGRPATKLWTRVRAALARETAWELAPPEWTGDVAMSVDHFIAACEARGLVQWDGVDTHLVAADIEREILRKQLQETV